MNLNSDAYLEAFGDGDGDDESIEPALLLSDGEASRDESASEMLAEHHLPDLVLSFVWLLSDVPDGRRQQCVIRESCCYCTGESKT